MLHSAMDSSFLPESNGRSSLKDRIIVKVNGSVEFQEKFITEPCSTLFHHGTAVHFSKINPLDHVVRHIFWRPHATCMHALDTPSFLPSSLGVVCCEGVKCKIVDKRLCRLLPADRGSQKQPLTMEYALQSSCSPS